MQCACNSPRTGLLFWQTSFSTTLDAAGHLTTEQVFETVRRRPETAWYGTISGLPLTDLAGSKNGIPGVL
jgi:hypothetical protein